MKLRGELDWSVWNKLDKSSLKKRIKLVLRSIDSKQR